MPKASRLLAAALSAAAVAGAAVVPANATTNTSKRAPVTPPGGIVGSKVVSYWKDASGANPSGQPNSPVILAHRGLFGTYNTSNGADPSVPENSLASLRAASAAGVEGVEMDVRASSNPDVPVIMHDATLGRTTNVFDPAVAPNPADADLQTMMRKEIVQAGGVAMPENLPAAEQERLTYSLTAEGAFSPYPKYDKQTGFGTAYGRNPKVSSLSPEVITNLNLLKFRDVAHPPAPAFAWNGESYVQNADDVSSEKVPTVDGLLEELSRMENPPVVVFDILENASLAAVAKIVANDTRQYAYGQEAKDLVVLKYRAKIAPNIDGTIKELQAATVAPNYPQGFIPNLVAIIAPYQKSATFDPAIFQSDWIRTAQQNPDYPLIGLDIVQTAPGASGTPLLQAAYDAKVSAGSFHDVPSYHGGDTLYPADVIAEKLYLRQDGSCCRSASDTGDPPGTKDLRWDFTWMIGKPQQPDAVNSGMITSDDPLSIIAELQKRGLREQATNAYRLESAEKSVWFETSGIRVNGPYSSQGPDVVQMYGDIYVYVSTDPERRAVVVDQPAERPINVPNAGSQGGGATVPWKSGAGFTDIPDDAQLCLGSANGLFGLSPGPTDYTVISAGQTSECRDIPSSGALTWRLTGDFGAWVELDANYEVNSSKK